MSADEPIAPFPLTTARSSATEAEIDLYTNGSCHVLAVALHRNLGWPMLVVTDPTQPSWVDDDDPDNQIDSVVHVFAVNDGMAWDIVGGRPESQAAEWCEERFGTMMPMIDEVFSEDGLAMYVEGASGEYDDDIDPHRPLHSYTDEDVEEAWEVAKRALGLGAEHRAKI